MPTLLEKWQTERDDLLDKMQSIVETEERTDATVKTLAEYETRVGTLTTQIEDHTRYSETRAAAAALDARGAVASIQQRSGDAFGQRNGRVLTAGEEWVASEQFRSYRGHGTSGALEIDLEERAPILTTTPDWDRALYRPQRVNVAEASDQFPLFDVCNVETVSTGSVDWVRYGFDAGAGAVGDASAAGNAAAVVAEGQPKPESALAAELVEAALETVAHWVQVSRQSLEDSTRMRSIVDGLLVRGVRYKEHTMLGGVITGAGLPSFTDPDLLAAIRGAIGKVQTAGFNPNAVLLNPADWAALDIGVMGSTLNGPVVRQSFWGLTPIPFPGQTPGSAVVGDFKAGVSHFRRSSVAVYVSDSHASTFIANIFTLLGEVRAKSAVVNPNALCETAALVGTAAEGGAGSGSAKARR